MGVKHPWLGEEDDALLRAWADVARSRPRSMQKELQRGFYELCAAASAASAAEQRSATSIMQRRSMFIRSYDAVREFHDRHQRRVLASAPSASGGVGVGDEQQQQEQADLDQVGDDVAQYSSDDFFALTSAEQRRWIASLDPRTYSVVPLDRVTFGRVDAILRDSGDAQQERTRFWVRPRGEQQAKTTEADEREPKKKRKRKGKMQLEEGDGDGDGGGKLQRKTSTEANGGVGAYEGDDERDGDDDKLQREDASDAAAHSSSANLTQRQHQADAVKNGGHVRQRVVTAQQRKKLETDDVASGSSTESDEDLRARRAAYASDDDDTSDATASHCSDEDRERSK